ncbi:hypothetical protein MKK75_21200 [Methylobacterium sp. J-030]|uniref:hypothetical protein n=1 Tax=Methylobacterium sp. J-030 TaxID=2836627 RepID=UPI001FB8F977|nr:hypothetical protein [Methylobacterium sp. J-030]MCJ2071278.1 hypothetical protein [Methylobacterium sp. J-030]
MARLISIAAAGAAALLMSGSARAASDITIASIAIGRLYVVGTTEQPHMPVVLDGQFRTESDDRGKFQYELIYHPSRCIVSAVIAGKTVEAVVSNCGEQCVTPASTGDQHGGGKPTQSAAPAPTPPMPGPTVSADATGGSEGPSARAPAPTPPRSRIARPPLPPQRPNSGLGT